MAAIDDDWIDVTEEFCTKEEWVLPVGDEGAMAAVFFGRAATGIGDGVAPPFPIAGPADAAAGCRGRVLFCGAWSRYHVFDPCAGVRHALPLPRRPRPHDAAIACDADDDGYSVVCAFEDCFEIYASASGQWRQVPAPAAAGVVAGSAAAFAGCVFWKTSASTGVLALDVASGTTRQIAPPHAPPTLTRSGSLASPPATSALPSAYWTASSCTDSSQVTSGSCFTPSTASPWARTYADGRCDSRAIASRSCCALAGASWPLRSCTGLSGRFVWRAPSCLRGTRPSCRGAVPCPPCRSSQGGIYPVHLVSLCECSAVVHVD